MKKKNLRPLILSSLAALAMAGIGTGATFALFTDKAETTINVAAGEIHVNLTLNNLRQTSADANADVKTMTDENGAQYGEQDGWVNGGTVSLTDQGIIQLQNMTPGDKAVYALSATSTSNIAIKYRLVVKAVNRSDKLHECLRLGVAGNEYDGLLTYRSAWVYLAPDAAGDIDFGDLSIFMPITTGNAYQNQSASFLVSIEAVQGNAVTDDGFKVEVIEAKQGEISQSGDVAFDNGTYEDANGHIQTIPETTILSTTTMADENGDPILAEENGSFSRVVTSSSEIGETETTLGFDITYTYNTEAESKEVKSFSEVLEFVTSISKGLTITSVKHNGIDLVWSDISTTPRQDQTYYYDSDNGLIYIWSSSYSPFNVSYVTTNYAVLDTDGRSVILSTNDATEACAEWTDGRILRLIGGVEGSAIKAGYAEDYAAIADLPAINGRLISESGDKYLDLNGRAIYNNDTPFTMTGGKVTILNKGGAIYCGYNSQNPTRSAISAMNATLDIQGGLIGQQGSEGIGIMAFNSDVTIAGAEVFGMSGAVNALGGTVAISAGKFSGGKDALSGGSVLNASNDAKIIVSGGEFTYKSAGQSAPLNTSSASIRLMGGTYNFDPSGYVARGYMASANEGQYSIVEDPNYVPPVVTLNGEEYSSFDEAIGNATSGTIQLQKDASTEKLAGEISTSAGIGARGIDGNFTIDLNGYTLTAEKVVNVEGNDYVFGVVIGEGGSLTIKDSSEAKTGKLVSPKLYVEEGVCVLESGTFEIGEIVADTYEQRTGYQLEMMGYTQNFDTLNAIGEYTGISAVAQDSGYTLTLSYYNVKQNMAKAFEDESMSEVLNGISAPTSEELAAGYPGVNYVRDGLSEEQVIAISEYLLEASMKAEIPNATVTISKVTIESGLLVQGGTFNFDPSSYLADSLTATESGNEWVVASNQ